MGHYVELTNLPPSIRAALKEAGYNRKDIEVNTAEVICPRPPSGQGRRGFTAVCVLSDDIPEYKMTWGSWGGSNMFVQTIDDVHQEVQIPPNRAFVMGTSSSPGYPGYAYITVHPSNMNPSLLPSEGSVSEREAKILAVFRALKSAYRKDQLDSMSVKDDEVDSLVQRGYLDRNKAGATKITTKGRNASARTYY